MDKKTPILTVNKRNKSFVHTLFSMINYLHTKEGETMLHIIKCCLYNEIPSTPREFSMNAIFVIRTILNIHELQQNNCS